jgi:hypothetical protein
MSTHTFLPYQQLMMDWLELMKNYMPYDSGVSKEAWDAWHKRLKLETSQALANLTTVDFLPRADFVAEVQSLQQLVDEWQGESESHIAEATVMAFLGLNDVETSRNEVKQ